MELQKFEEKTIKYRIPVFSVVTETKQHNLDIHAFPQ